MLTPRSAITIESRVDDTISRYPSTGPIFRQGQRARAPLPGTLAAPVPEQTVGEYAALNRLAIERLLESVNGAAEAADRFARRAASGAPSREDGPGWHARGSPPVGSLGYTGSYQEPSADVGDVSAVSVLLARGPV